MSTADEIKKLKELLDEGVLSEEEFNSEKNKLLASKSSKTEKEKKLEESLTNIKKSQNKSNDDKPKKKKESKKRGKLKWIVGLVAILLVIIPYANETDRANYSSNSSSSNSSSSNSSSSNSSSSSSSSSSSWGSCSLSSYGSLSSQSLNGSGDSIITYGGNGGIVSFSHSGSSNVALTTYDVNGGYLDLLVNEIGNYSGNHIFGIWAGEEVAEFEISADGNWTLSLQSVASGSKKVNGASISGKGSEVINTTSVCDYKYIDVTHNGSSNLAVWGISPKGTYPEDLLINEIGNYTGTVRLPQYIELLVIEADGSWQVIFTK